MDKENLSHIYNETTYYVILDQTYRIHLNKKNDSLNLYLKGHNISSWAIITAYNPKSQLLSNEENISRQEHLKKELAEFKYFYGYNPESEDWPEEKTFLVTNISEEGAGLIAQKFDQNAFVYGEINQHAKLIWCIDLFSDSGNK